MKLSIWDTEITMRANGSELGNWSTDAVTIRALDARSFEFVAEGDHLVFAPDDPEGFGRHPLVAGTILGSKRKRSRKSKEPKPIPGRVELAWDQDSPEELRRNQQRPKRQEDPVAPPPSRRERRKAASEARSAAEDPAMAGEPSLPPPAIVSAHPTEVPREPMVPHPAESKKVKAHRERPDKELTVGPSHGGRFATARHNVWIAALDQARKYDLLGLDRVPVNENLRGQDHEHTWDHRVAPASGPGSRICTLCGKFRRG